MGWGGVGVGRRQFTLNVSSEYAGAGIKMIFDNWN